MKFLILILNIFFCTNLLAVEQSFQIINNLDVQEIKDQEDAYVEIINSIMDDVMNNGIYFTVGGKNISQSKAKFTYSVNDVKAYLKRDIFDRNVEKAKFFKSRKILNLAEIKSGNIFFDKYENKLFWISAYRGYSLTCFEFRLLDKTNNIIQNRVNLQIKQNLTIDDFLTAPNLTNVYSANELLNSTKDILLAEDSIIYENMDLDDISNIGGISLKTTKCNINP